MSQEVSIIAPSDMEEGYQFDAQVDGKTFTVSVPRGGVRAGEEFTTVAPFAAEDEPNRFRFGLFEWWTGDSQCVMGYFCSGCLLGQLLQRLKLSFYGVKTNDDQYENSCIIMTVAYGIALLLGFILVIATGAGFMIMYIYLLYLVVVLTLTRLHMRNLYRIPGQMFGDTPLDDFCFSFWCTCCTLLQLTRHTHDGNVYNYRYDTKTGLPEGAPEVV